MAINELKIEISASKILCFTRYLGLMIEDLILKNSEILSVSYYKKNHSY